MMSKILFIILWVLTVLLVLFSVISFAGVVTRIPALISLSIAIMLLIFRKQSNSLMWIILSIIGILISLSTIYPLVTAYGFSATSSVQSIQSQSSLTPGTILGWNHHLYKIVKTINPSNLGKEFGKISFHGKVSGSFTVIELQGANPNQSLIFESSNGEFYLVSVVTTKWLKGK